MPDRAKYTCIIQAGELDSNGHRYVKNDLYRVEVVKNIELLMHK